MGHLTIDRQAASETCEHCSHQYRVSRGSVYNDNVPFALYMAGMHGCGKLQSVVLAIAIKDAEQEYLSAVFIQIWPTETEYQMVIIDPSISPWRTHTYLGRMLTREEALASPLKETFFHIADHVVAENPDVNGFLEGIL